MVNFEEWKNEKEQRLIYLDELNRKRNSWLFLHSSDLERISGVEKNKKIIDILKDEMSLDIVDKEVGLSLIVSQLYDLTEYTNESIAPTLEERKETFDNLETILEARNDDEISSKIYLDSHYSDFLIDILEEAKNKNLREELTIEKNQIINEIEQVKLFIDDVLAFRKLESLSDDKVILTYKSSILKPLLDKKKELDDSLSGIDKSTIAGIIMSSELLEVNKKIDEINNTDISSKDARNYLVDLLIDPSHKNDILTYEYAKTLESVGITDYDSVSSESAYRIVAYEKIVNASNDLRIKSQLIDKFNLLISSNEYLEYFNFENSDVAKEKKKCEKLIQDSNDKLTALEVIIDDGNNNKNYENYEKALKIRKKCEDILKHENASIIHSRKSIRIKQQQDFDDVDKYIKAVEEFRSITEKNRTSPDKYGIKGENIRNLEKATSDYDSENKRKKESLIRKCSSIFGDSSIIDISQPDLISEILGKKDFLSNQVEMLDQLIENQYTILGTTQDDLPLEEIAAAKSKEQGIIDKVSKMSSLGFDNMDELKTKFKPLVDIDGIDIPEMSDMEFYTKIEDSVSRKR